MSRSSNDMSTANRHFREITITFVFDFRWSLSHNSSRFSLRQFVAEKKIESTENLDYKLFFIL